MKGKNIITMNGRQYDALTGMPLTQTPAAATAPSPAPEAMQPTPVKKPAMPVPPAARPQPKQRMFSDFAAPVQRPAKATAAPMATTGAAKKPAISRSTPAAHAIHQKPQRSHTLYRGALKRPEAPAPIAPAQQQPPRPATPAKPPVHRSPSISKFGSLYDSASPAQAPAQPATQPTPEPLESPQIHPAIAKAITTLQQKKQAQATPAQPPVQSSKDLKESLIKERLAQVDASEKATKAKKRGLFASPKRLTTVLTSTLAILLLAGYLTYINLPNISMRVAATRAGVSAANFPNYRPDGYSFAGPITYSPGEIAINFKSNTNDQAYSVKQKSSNWDSQAVLDNFVTKYTDSYLTYQERGLTIYSFDDKAAWVNGGLLYTIEGNAKLTGEQILRIATSM